MRIAAKERLFGCSLLQNTATIVPTQMKILTIAIKFKQLENYVACGAFLQKSKVSDDDEICTNEGLRRQISECRRSLDIKK